MTIEELKNTVHCGDCLEVMKDIPDNSIDMVLTDPPYNIARETNFKTMKSRGGNVAMQFGGWDKDADILTYISFLPRVLKENSNIVIFNCWENLGKIKETCMQNKIQIKRCLVLSKSNPAPFNRDRMFVNDVEFALWGVYNSKNKPTKWTFNREQKLEKCVLNTTVQNSVFHPTMKDIKIIEKLIRLLTKEGDTVLDLFAGSGTTGVACKNTNRNYILIEKEPEYIDIINKRLKETSSKNPNS